MIEIPQNLMGEVFAVSPLLGTYPLAVRGCYRCLNSLDNLHLLQDVLICFVSTSQVEPGAI